MKHNLMIILALIVGGLTLCKPKPVNPPEDPKPVTPEDTTTHYDTTYVDTFRIDTVRVDTLIKDTTIDLVNDRIVLSYASVHYDIKPSVKYTTHICFSCAALDMDGSTYKGFSITNNNYNNRFEKVVALKQKKPELKILLSFGNFGNEFSVMVADSAARRQFAKDCLAFCQNKGIDGIDLDWEFPGQGTGSDPAHDVDNFTELVKVCREVMGNDYLITFAGAICDKQQCTGGWRYIDLKAVEPYIDFVNLMNYDFSQAPQPHNALVASGAYWDILRSWKNYDKAGFPMNKLIMGVAFYGRHTFTSGVEDAGELFYKDILIRLQLPNTQYTTSYHKLWDVPVLYKNGTMWCSYDDPQSIAAKGAWALSKGMGGIMHWQVAGDNTACHLQKACWKSMKQEDRKDTTFTYVTDTIHYQDTIITPVHK